jgi:hypothetical protein
MTEQMPFLVSSKEYIQMETVLNAIFQVGKWLNNGDMEQEPIL